MKRILFVLILLFPSIIKAEGLDQKINDAFAPISNFFSNLVFFKLGDHPFVISMSKRTHNPATMSLTTFIWENS